MRSGFAEAADADDILQPDDTMEVQARRIVVAESIFLFYIIIERAFRGITMLRMANISHNLCVRHGVYHFFAQIAVPENRNSQPGVALVEASIKELVWYSLLYLRAGLEEI